MSLFKNQDKMEKQLRSQLNGLEYKPSDSMWNRIENEMRGDFEHSLEQKLRKYDVAPDPALWEKIEAELPIEKKKNHSGKIIIALLLLSLIGLSAYLVQLNIQLNQKAQLLAAHALVQLKPSSKNEPANVLPENNKPEFTTIDKNQYSAKGQNTTSFEITPSLHKETNSQKTSRIIQYNKPASVVSATKQADNIGVEGATEADNSIEKNHNNTSNPISLNSANNIPIQPNIPSTQQIDLSTNSTTNNSSDTTSAASPIASTIKPFEETTTEPKDKGQKFDEDAPTNFSISIVTGANLCYNYLVTPSAGTLNFDKNIKLRNQLENTSIDWSGLFMLDYHVNDRLHISSGIGILNFSQTFYYNTTTPVVVNPGVETRAVIINPNDSIINGNSLSTRIKYSWTEIPVYISYRFTQNRRFNFELQGGFSYAVLSTVDAGMVSYDNVGVLLVKDKSAFPNLRNSFFVSLNPTVTYNLNQTVTLGIMPSAKISLNSMIDNNNWVQQYPYFVGFSAMLRKRF